MRWEGCVCVSWTIRSPRSVSTTSMPSDSRYGLSSISSPAIDLTLVTTGRCCPPAAFQQICPMIARASAASLAKWTLPPTASSRSVNRSTSSGNLSRLARRRCFRSARPAAKSKVAKAALRRLRRPVIAWTRAPCSLGSSRALLTRLEKWRLDSGTRLECFPDRLADRSWCRHRGQAYGPDAHHGAIIVAGLDHGVWICEHRRPRELGVAGAHLDRVSQSVEGAREDSRHQAVLAWQRRDGLERPEGASRIRSFGFTDERVQLHQRDGADRVLNQWLDAVAQPAQLIGPGVVEVAAQIGIGVTILDVLGDVAGVREPMVAQAGLVRTYRRPKPPNLVGQLAGDALGVSESGARLVSIFEQALQQLGGTLLQNWPLASSGSVEVSDRQRRVPGRVDAAVHVRGVGLSPPAGVERVVVLVGVLAAGIETRHRIAQDPVEVAGGGIKRVVQPAERQGVDESGVVLEHLFEMRHAPVLRGRVAEETTLDVVVGAARGHHFERMRRHRAQLRVGVQLRLLQEQEDGVGLRKFGR